MGEGEEEKDEEAFDVQEGESGVVRNSASRRFRRSATVIPGGRLKFGLLILLYAGLFLMLVGVVR